MTEPDRQPAADQDQRTFRAESWSLWRLVVAPMVWALHFLLCYATVSLSCARGLFPIGNARLALIGATVVALGLIVWIAWRALRQWDVLDTGVLTHPGGKAEDRHRFIGHATFLIAVISLIGTVYTSLPLLMLEGCR